MEIAKMFRCASVLRQVGFGIGRPHKGYEDLAREMCEGDDAMLVFVRDDGQGPMYALTSPGMATLQAALEEPDTRPVLAKGSAEYRALNAMQGTYGVNAMESEYPGREMCQTLVEAGWARHVPAPAPCGIGDYPVDSMRLTRAGRAALKSAT